MENSVPRFVAVDMDYNNAILAEEADLDALKAEVVQKIDDGEIDESVETVAIYELNGVYQIKRQTQLVFTEAEVPLSDNPRY